MAVTGVSERIQWIVEHRGISARRLALDAGLSHSALSFTLREGGDVKVETAKAIARAAGVSERWLVLGEGAPDDATPSPSHAPDDAPPLQQAIPGWEDAVRVARQLDPDLPDVAIERAARSARLLTRAHATPGLVVELARLAMKYADSDFFDQLRAEGAARVQRQREAHDALYERGVPLPADVDTDELTDEGRKALAEGRLKAGPPPTYRGGADAARKKSGG